MLPEGPTPTPHAAPHPEQINNGVHRRRPTADRLRTAIGLAPDGTPVHLDLKEAVDNGLGPHGSIAGPHAAATLHTIALNLASTHVPDELSFIIINAAPPQTFTALGQLPHTEVLLNAPDIDQLPRLIEAVEGELTRRKRLLVATGCSSNRQYLRNPTNPPMPALLLICHNFTQLIDDHPPLLDLIRRIGWLGRARGIHLILTTPDQVSHDLTSYLSYRITDGLLHPGTSAPIPFRPGPTPDPPLTAPPPTHRIWLPPLGISPTLEDLAGPIVTDPDHLPRFADKTLHNTLQVPIAVLDKPREHRQDIIWLPAPGHVAIVGGPGSGRSTFLRTSMAALSLSHSPPDVRVIATPTHQHFPLIHGLAGTPEAMRALHTRLDAPSGDTIVVIDDWPEFWRAHPDWHDLLLEIARRGSTQGVHLIAAATTWSDFDPQFTDHFASRLELRLTDPAESTIDPAAAATIPSDRPGRGMVAAPSGALHFLTARPGQALLDSLATDHCPECGFTYASVPAADLPTRFRTAGTAYAAALLAVTDARRRPSPEVWSPLEYTCHVRDMLQVQRERLALALRVDNPAFTPMGRDERPARDGYNTQDPHTVLTELDQAAESLAAAFASLSPAELARTGVYNWPTPAARDLRWIGRHTVHEIVHHLDDIARQR